MNNYKIKIFFVLVILTNMNSCVSIPKNYNNKSPISCIMYKSAFEIAVKSRCLDIDSLTGRAFMELELSEKGIDSISLIKLRLINNLDTIVYWDISYEIKHKDFNFYYDILRQHILDNIIVQILDEERAQLKERYTVPVYIGCPK